MKNFLGLCAAALAALLLMLELMLISQILAIRAGRVFPFMPRPLWPVAAGLAVGIGILAWTAMRLLRPGSVGRLVRGPGLNPEPRR